MSVIKHIKSILKKTFPGLKQDTAQRLTGIEQQLELINDNLLKLSMRANRPDVRRIRVVFLVHADELWYALKPVADKMKQDKLFEVIVVSIPYDISWNGSGIANRCGTFAAEYDLVVSLENCDRIITALNPDIIFRQQPHDQSMLEPFRTKRLLAYKICYVPYGLATNPLGNFVYNQELQNYAWRLYCIDEHHKACYRKYNLTADCNALVVGNTKFEYLYSAISENETAWPVQRDDLQPVSLKILWCPHHSYNDQYNFSCFPESCDGMLEFAQSAPEYDIVMRPHFCMRTAVLVKSMMDIARFDKYMNDFGSEANCAVDSGGEYAHLFRHADVLVTDGVAFLFEFLLTGKPVIFLDNEKNIGFDDYYDHFRAGWYVVHDVQGVRKVVKMLSAGKDDLKDIRQQLAKELYDINSRTPSSAIIEDIKKATGYYCE